ncbi:MAG: hypothetical protein AAFV51_05165 [Pseudomonadota bacterium]
MPKRFLSGPVFFMAACAGTPQPAAPDAAPPTIDPSAFIGGPASAVSDRLGPPTFERAEGLGAFRRYDGDACAVYVVTGPGEGGAPVVLSVAAASRDPEGPDIDAGACLAEIATAGA